MEARFGEHKGRFEKIKGKFFEKFSDEEIREMMKPPAHLTSAIEHTKAVGKPWEDKFMDNEDLGNIMEQYAYDPNSSFEKLIEDEYEPKFDAMKVREILGLDLVKTLDVLSDLHESGDKAKYDEAYRKMESLIRKQLGQLHSQHLDKLYKIYSGKKEVPEKKEERDDLIQKVNNDVSFKLKNSTIGLAAGAIAKNFEELGRPEIQTNPIKREFAKLVDQFSENELNELARKARVNLPKTEAEKASLRSWLKNSIRESGPKEILEIVNELFGTEPVEMEFPPYPYHLLDALHSYLVNRTFKRLCDSFEKAKGKPT